MAIAPPRSLDPYGDQFTHAGFRKYAEDSRAEPDPIKLGLIARTLQAEADRDHMLERLRDLAAMARDDTDPYLELEVFRLQAEINGPLLK